MDLRDLLLEAVLPPISILILLLLGVLFWRCRRLSRGLMLLATALFLLAALPGVGELLTRPLAGAAERFDPDAGAGGITAVLVPTGGAYQDAGGRWWPAVTSVQRAAIGAGLAKHLGLPLILAGGNPNPGEPSEARVLAATMELALPDVRIEPSARDSAETGAAVAELLDGRVAKVLLVTSPTHVARMSAALRHHGIAVLIAPDAAADDLARPSAWLPQYNGLGRTRAALYEYIGIAWYLVSGRITLADLEF